MTIVTFGSYSFDTDDLRGRGFLTPYVVNGVTYELETAMRVAAALDLAATAAKAGKVADTIAAAQSTLSLVWGTATADADPGSGGLRASTAVLTAGSYTLYASTSDANGADVSGALAGYGTSSSATKGRLRVTKQGAASVYVDLDVTGVTVASGYRKIAVTYVGGPGGFASGDALVLGFARSGDKGDVGGASLPAGSAAAPGLAVAGDSNTGLAQIGGPDTLSGVAGEVEVLRLLAAYLSLGGAPGGEGLRVSVGSYASRIRIEGRSSAGNAPIIWTEGQDANISLEIRLKGLGGCGFIDGNNAYMLQVIPVAGANRNVVISSSAGGSPTISTSGGGLNLSSATGEVQINGAPISSAVKLPSLGTKSAAYTVTVADAGKLILMTGTWTLSLPAAATAGSGFTIAYKNVGTGSITVDPYGAETVDGAAALALAAGKSGLLVCDGTGWSTVGERTGTSTLAFDGSAHGTNVSIGFGGRVASCSAGNTGLARTNGVLPLGKWVWGVRAEAVASGVGVSLVAPALNGFLGSDANGWSYDGFGNKVTNGGSVAFGASYGAGAVIYVYAQVTATQTLVWFAKDGVVQGGGDPVVGTSPAFTIASTAVYPAAGLSGGSVATLLAASTELPYTPLSGFAAIP